MATGVQKVRGGESSEGWSTDRFDPGNDWADLIWQSVKHGTDPYSRDEFASLFPGSTDNDYQNYINEFGIARANDQERDENLSNLQESAVEAHDVDFQAYPELQNFLRWFFPQVQEAITRSRQEYPFDITTEASSQEKDLMNFLRSRLSGGGVLTPPPEGLSREFEDVYKSRLPDLQKQQRELDAAEEERLANLGFDKFSTVGSISARNRAEQFKLENQLMEYESGVGLAGAKEANWSRLLNYEMAESGLTDSDIEQAMSLLGMQESRAEQNISSQIGQWQNTTGLTGMSSLGVSAGGVANAGLSSSVSKYGIDVSSIDTRWEAAFMQPYLEKALDSDGGGKK